ncbi:FecR family protein [Pseudomonas aeruginosa]|uniref:FecR domain-containing protein n=53 Tax=Pseudomonas aeruginosa TaxID=287 RepID=UPI0021F20EAD|nr:FecR family protein [Pseudomonas aeruginosa]MCV4388341.1 FecR family protein [Pseudomonas aeruginosa]
MNAADEGRIPSPILDEAAEWLVRLQDSGCTDDTRQACAQWRQRSPQHAHAWERAERLLQCLGRLPPALALPTLGRERGLDRRRAIKHLALVLGGASLGLATWQAEPLRDWLADQRTGVGEQRRLTLPDGSLLTLNTDSAVDLAFDASQRLVRLLRGEIFVDSRADPRPFRVATAEARLHAGAARFNVRQEMAAPRGAGLAGGGARPPPPPGGGPPPPPRPPPPPPRPPPRAAVLAGRVELSPLHGRGRWLESGESVRLGADGEARRLAFDGLPDAWTRGMLMADRMPLAEVLAELARYRRGVLRCDPQLARLAVSGAYPLLDLRRTLGMLQATYPLKVRGLTDYWISLVPA